MYHTHYNRNHNSTTPVDSTANYRKPNKEAVTSTGNSRPIVRSHNDKEDVPLDILQIPPSDGIYYSTSDISQGK